jgi:uncharacterized protein YndB with AHSA1/START domain
MPKSPRTDQASEPANRELVITRLFDAPRELVFDAFTKPDHLMKWWGPHGCTVISCETEPRVAGPWCISMRSPKLLPQFANRHAVWTERNPRLATSGGDSATPEEEYIVEKQRGIYQEIVRPERIVFTYAFEDHAGRPLHQTLVTVTFADEGGRTRLTLRQAVFETVSARDDHVRGWTEALQHLEEYLTRAE